MDHCNLYTGRDDELPDPALPDTQSPEAPDKFVGDDTNSATPMQSPLVSKPAVDDLVPESDLCSSDDDELLFSPTKAPPTVEEPFNTKSKSLFGNVPSCNRSSKPCGDSVKDRTMNNERNGLKTNRDSFQAKQEGSSTAFEKSTSKPQKFFNLLFKASEKNYVSSSDDDSDSESMLSQEFMKWRPTKKKTSHYKEKDQCHNLTTKVTWPSEKTTKNGGQSTSSSVLNLKEASACQDQQAITKPLSVCPRNLENRKVPLFSQTSQSSPMFSQAVESQPSSSQKNVQRALAFLDNDLDGCAAISDTSPSAEERGFESNADEFFRETSAQLQSRTQSNITIKIGIASEEGSPPVVKVEMDKSVADGGKGDAHSAYQAAKDDCIYVFDSEDEEIFLSQKIPHDSQISDDLASISSVQSEEYGWDEDDALPYMIDLDEVEQNEADRDSNPYEIPTQYEENDDLCHVPTQEMDGINKADCDSNPYEIPAQVEKDNDFYNVPTQEIDDINEAGIGGNRYEIPTDEKEDKLIESTIEERSFPDKSCSSNDPYSISTQAVIISDDENDENNHHSQTKAKNDNRTSGKKYEDTLRAAHYYSGKHGVYSMPTQIENEEDSEDHSNLSKASNQVAGDEKSHCHDDSYYCIATQVTDSSNGGETNCHHDPFSVSTQCLNGMEKGNCHDDPYSVPTQGIDDINDAAEDANCHDPYSVPTQGIDDINDAAEDANCHDPYSVPTQEIDDINDAAEDTNCHDPYSVPTQEIDDIDAAAEDANCHDDPYSVPTQEIDDIGDEQTNFHYDPYGVATQVEHSNNKEDPYFQQTLAVDMSDDDAYNQPTQISDTSVGKTTKSKLGIDGIYNQQTQVFASETSVCDSSSVFPMKQKKNPIEEGALVKNNDGVSKDGSETFEVITYEKDRLKGKFSGRREEPRNKKANIQPSVLTKGCDVTKKSHKKKPSDLNGPNDVLERSHRNIQDILKMGNNIVCDFDAKKPSGIIAVESCLSRKAVNEMERKERVKTNESHKKKASGLIGTNGIVEQSHRNSQDMARKGDNIAQQFDTKKRSGTVTTESSLCKTAVKIDRIKTKESERASNNLSPTALLDEMFSQPLPNFRREEKNDSKASRRQPCTSSYAKSNKRDINSTGRASSSHSKRCMSSTHAGSKDTKRQKTGLVSNIDVKNKEKVESVEILQSKIKLPPQPSSRTLTGRALSADAQLKGSCSKSKNTYKKSKSGDETGSKPKKKKRRESSPDHAFSTSIQKAKDALKKRNKSVEKGNSATKSARLAAKRTEDIDLNCEDVCMPSTQDIMGQGLPIMADLLINRNRLAQGLPSKVLDTTESEPNNIVPENCSITKVADKAHGKHSCSTQSSTKRQNHMPSSVQFQRDGNTILSGSAPSVDPKTKMTPYSHKHTPSGCHHLDSSSTSTYFPKACPAADISLHQSSTAMVQDLQVSAKKVGFGVQMHEALSSDKTLSKDQAARSGHQASISKPHTTLLTTAKKSSLAFPSKDKECKEYFTLQCDSAGETVNLLNASPHPKQLDTLKTPSIVHKVPQPATPSSLSSKSAPVRGMGILKSPLRATSNKSATTERPKVTNGETYSKAEPVKRVGFNEVQNSVRIYPHINAQNQARNISIQQTKSSDECPVIPYKKNMVHALLRWNPAWLKEQGNSNVLPPLLGDDKSHLQQLEGLQLYYESRHIYSKVTSNLLKLELWEGLLKAWQSDKKYAFKGRESRKVYLNYHPPENAVTSVNQISSFALEGYSFERSFNLYPGDLLLLSSNSDETKPTPGSDCGKTQFAYVNAFWRKNPQRLGDNSTFDLKIETKQRLLLTSRGSLIAHKFCNIVSEERLMDVLQSLQRNEFMKSITLNPALNKHIFHHEYVLPASHPNLNTEQILAVNTIKTAVLSPGPAQKVFLLQGPPGTGKSHTILALVDGILRVSGFRKRICLATPSNAAVDELAQRIINFSQKQQRARKPTIRLVRVGKKESTDLNVQPFCLKTQTEKQAFEVAKENLPDSVRKEMKFFEDKITDLEKSLRSYQDDKSIQRASEKVDLCKFKRKLENLQRKPHSRDFDEAELRVLRESHVVCGTLSSFGSPRLRQFLSKPCFNRNPFDCIIVDEATQAKEIECLIPLQYNCTKLVLVGDQQQLQPTILSKLAQEKELGRSLFTRLHMCLTVGEEQEQGQSWVPGPTSPVLTLRRQYRMSDAILEFPNKAFYQGKLFTDELVKRKRAENPYALAPYLVFDVAESQERSSGAGENMSLANPVEANCTGILCEIISHMIRKVAVTQNRAAYQERIGVICPYSEQKREIGKELQKRRLEKIAVETVDAFQGQEKDVIIMSCVRASSEPSSIGFLAEKERMNVSLTRAKQALYIIGHFKTLRIKPLWRALHENAEERNLVVPVSRARDFSKIAEKKCHG